MKTSSPPLPSVELSGNLYYQIVQTLNDLLPPPLDDSPEALRARNRAAIARVAALLPVNADEADLAARCIAARSHAEDALRLLRQRAGDIGLVLRLNAQYGSMVRTSLAEHGRLMRMQAERQKQEAVEAAANGESRPPPVAERSMPGVAEPGAGRREAARPGAAAVAAPAVGGERRIEDDASKNETNSHGAAFETRMSQHPLRHASGGSGGSVLDRVLRAARAEARLDAGGFRTNGRDSPGWAA